MKIKICGITSLSNAIEIAKLNIDYLGFNFYSKSPRYIDIDKAQKIIEKTKKINKKIKSVGIFVNEDIDKIKKIIKQCNLDIVQLHGDESPKYCRELRKSAEVWKSIIVKNKKDLEKIKIYAKIADKILLDAGYGSGKQIAFSLLKNLKVEILAGGLGVNNIQEVVKKIKPENN